MNHKYKLIVCCLVLVILLNVVTPLDATFPIRVQLVSLSPAQRYQGWLSLYRYYVEKHQLTLAKTIEPLLNNEDTAALKSEYYPEEIARTLNVLQYQTNKTPENWIEIAKLQLKMGLTSQAKETLRFAHEKDLIREDLEKLYFQFK